MKLRLSILLAAIALLAPASSRAQALAWEKSLDSVYATDYYIQDIAAPIINYGYPIAASTRERIEFLDIATGKSLISLPRPALAKYSYYYITRDWADLDSGFEVLVWQVDSGSFTLYDGDKVMLQGKGGPQWMTDGKSTFLIVKSSAGTNKTLVQTYLFRQNIPVSAAGRGLGKSSAEQERTWIAIGPHGPEIYRAGGAFDARGRLLSAPAQGP